jgi:hypothetical protein
VLVRAICDDAFCVDVAKMALARSASVMVGDRFRRGVRCSGCRRLRRVRRARSVWRVGPIRLERRIYDGNARDRTLWIGVRAEWRIFDRGALLRASRDWIWPQRRIFNNRNVWAGTCHVPTGATAVPLEQQPFHWSNSPSARCSEPLPGTSNASVRAWQRLRRELRVHKERK